jgi:Protein of unknown function (DUF3060)
MKVVMAVLLVPILAFADKQIADKNTATWDCKADPIVAITANNVTVRITGTCNDVTIAGNHDTVHVAHGQTVTINGNHNTVDTGGVDAVMVAGNDNAVTSKKDAYVNDIGKRNTVTQ